MRTIVAIVTACVLAGSIEARASEPAGSREYVNSCAVCHGLRGKGDGSMAGLLKRAPTDLTELAQRNGGQFPFLAVLKKIDGRDAVAGHGDSAMPVWGDRFKAVGEDENEVRGRILGLVLFLESLQKK